MSSYPFLFVVLFTQLLVAMNENLEQIESYVFPQAMLEQHEQRRQKIDFVLQQNCGYKTVYEAILDIKMEIYWLRQKAALLCELQKPHQSSSDLNENPEEKQSEREVAHTLLTLEEINPSSSSSGKSFKRKKLDSKKTVGMSKKNKKSDPVVQHNSTLPFVTASCRNDENDKPVFVYKIYER